MAQEAQTTTQQYHDRVYLSKSGVMEGKVTEVGPNQVRMLTNVRPDGPVYVINIIDVDSIVYTNGQRDELKGFPRKKDLLANIPQLNTWTFDLLGFTFLTVSQSYERRLSNGFMGIRVPLYIGFIGGGIAGVGLFTPPYGIYYPQAGGGFSIATGVNPKFYFFKRRIIRAFAGPEVTIGYTKSDGYYYDNNNTGYSGTIKSGTITAIGKAGLMINPVDKFNITIDGGAGVGDMFGSAQSLGTVGLWHIGLSLGTNF